MQLVIMATRKGWRCRAGDLTFLGAGDHEHYGDHDPPPSHVRYGNQKALIVIETLALLAGVLPPRAMGLAMEWAARHREALLANWKRARRQEPLLRIPPLEW